MANGGKINGEEDKKSQALRVTAAIKYNLGEEGVPLFITHGGNIMRMMEVALGVKTQADTEAFKKNISRPANCSLYEFVTPSKKEGKWQVNEITLENQKIQRKSVNMDLSKADMVMAGRKNSLETLGNIL